MLPFPGSPGASWPLYKAQAKNIFGNAHLWTCVAFWLFGLINNVLYVIILSAALDLVGPNVPKGLVLIADVMPSFITKLVAPYFIHSVPYSARVLVFATLSMWGMLLIALTPDSVDGGAIATKMAGVVLASLSSGGGELSFLGLTHYYGHSSLAAWASGTGGAGLVGAGAYVTATTIFQWSVRRSLLAFSLLPVIMLISFFLILPRAPLRRAASSIISTEERVPRGASDDADSIDTEEQSLLSSSQVSTSHHESLKPGAERTRGKLRYAWRQFKANLNRSRHLFFPYMLPLLLVYVSEYTINQGVAPTLLFPLSSTPFSHFRAFYPTYNAIYQTGVFISRSSTPFIRFHQLYPPSVLQCLNLIILTFQALYGFLPNVYCVFALVFWEGLLGGLVYVNTFAEITDRVKEEDREFSLGATSVSDSAGVCIAGFLGMAMEAWLCNWQVKRGIDFCRQV